MLNNEFNLWNFLKQKINSFKEKEFYVKEKQVWLINQWKNIWFESNWKWKNFRRPVLILKKVWWVFFVVAMTTKWKKDNIFYYNLDKTYFNKESAISLSQVKIIDKKRFLKQIWEINWQDFQDIKKELKKLLF